MSGVTDPQVLEAAQILCMLATSDSHIPVQNAITAIQTPPPPVQSSALVQSTTPAEQTPPAQPDTNPEDKYTMRALLLQFLLTVPAGGWVRPRDMYVYLCDKYPGLKVLNPGEKHNVMAHFDVTLQRMMSEGLLEKWKPRGRNYWRIKEGKRQWAISMAMEKDPDSWRLGRPYGSGSRRVLNVQPRGRVALFGPRPALEPASPESAPSGPASPAPALPMQSQAGARAAPAEPSRKPLPSIRPRGEAPAGKQLHG